MLSFIKEKLAHVVLLKTVASWARAHKMHDGTKYIYYHSHASEGYFAYSPILVSKKNHAVGLILAPRGQLEDAITSSGVPHEGKCWRVIGGNSVYEVWERILSPEKSAVMPLRLGLPLSEMEDLLFHARDVLTHALTPESRVTDSARTKKIVSYPRFALPARVDVILWVGGELRGSQIAESENLLEAISRASLRAMRDVRFKTLSPEDLPQLRIEICLMGNLLLPITEKDIARNNILTEKGYVTIRGEKRGYFVPAIFNCTNIQSLRGLLLKLTQEKLGDGGDEKP